MPEIGASLREARMRSRIDISEAEADTKIRGKYLRALENEEWDLLPGPTFVKSFLRTYGDYLELDGRMLVEEFKLRYEQSELQPISPPRSRGDRGRERPRRSNVSRPGNDRRRVPARALVIGGLLAALLIALFFLGRGGGDDATTPTTAGGAGATTPGSQTTRTSTQSRSTTDKQPATPKVVRLRIVATGTVFACLRGAGSRTLLDGVNLVAGASTPTFRSSRFRLTLGNGNARLVVDGRSRSVPDVSDGIGYEITPADVRRLSPAERPTCT